MKKFKHIITSFALLLFLSSFIGINEDISAALKAGSAFKVAAFFQSKVDITILEESELLTKLEAEKMLYDFFYDHKPSEFKILHQGESKSGLQYTIGRLETNKGNFRISYYINSSNQKEYIQQIIIDAE